MRKYILATALVFGLMSGNVFAEKFEGQQAENLFRKLIGLSTFIIFFLFFIIVFDETI